MSSPPTPPRLSPELLQAFQEIKSVRLFAKDAILFQAGSAATGIYLVESGEVRVVRSTSQTQQNPFEVAGPGTMFGLSECLSGEKCQITAEANDETTAAFIPREKLLAVLRENGDFCMEVLRLLIGDLHGLYHKFRGISAHPGRPRRRSLDEQVN